MNNHSTDTFDNVANANGIRSESTSTCFPNNESTVLVIGGGVVGCLTALKLGQAGIDVQIIERSSEISNAPRAVGYYAAVLHFFEELGVYQPIREKGFFSRGLCWRTKPKDDGKGGKRWGDLVAFQPLCAPGDDTFPVGSGCLNLTQGQLNILLLERALKTGHVRLDFNTELLSIVENSKNGVQILARDVSTEIEKNYRARYCIGADGSHSGVRKALGLTFPGYTWPERLLATNVVMPNVEDPIWHIHYYMGSKHWGVGTPLEEPVVGTSTLWRWAIAIGPEENLSDEELLSDENILSIYEDVMPGPRPLQVEIEARVMYKIHQRLAPTMRKGNILLAGDAAHVNNPMGALGLNTGILDVDALGEALIMILKEGRSDQVLDVYSDERRKVFQTFVDPTSANNKLRIHNNNPETAAQDDWYFRITANPTAQQLMDLAKPYFETWRTDMRKATKGI